MAKAGAGPRITRAGYRQEGDSVKRINANGDFVDSLWAFLRVGDTGGEGLCFTPLGAMVTGDKMQITELRRIAKKIATDTGRPILLVHYHGRADVEEIEP